MPESKCANLVLLDYMKVFVLLFHTICFGKLDVHGNVLAETRHFS